MAAILTTLVPPGIASFAFPGRLEQIVRAREFVLSSKEMERFHFPVTRETLQARTGGGAGLIACPPFLLPPRLRVRWRISWRRCGGTISESWETGEEEGRRRSGRAPSHLITGGFNIGAIRCCQGARCGSSVSVAPATFAALLSSLQLPHEVPQRRRPLPGVRTRSQMPVITVDLEIRRIHPGLPKIGHHTRRQAWRKQRIRA